MKDIRTVLLFIVGTVGAAAIMTAASAKIKVERNEVKIDNFIEVVKDLKDEIKGFRTDIKELYKGSKDGK